MISHNLNNICDLIISRIKIKKPKKIVFSVGAQINGVPHIGTYIVIVTTFLLAKKIQQDYGFESSVKFNAYDDAPFDITKGADGTEYQKNIVHAFEKDKYANILNKYYITLLKDLHNATNIKYEWENYQQLQSSEKFRIQFLKSLRIRDKLGWCIAPTNGKPRIRLPKKRYRYYAQKNSENLEILDLTKEYVQIKSKSIDGDSYISIVNKDSTLDNEYVGVNGMYRSIIKESIYTEDIRENNILMVMVKGGDWSLATEPLDWGLGIMGYRSDERPMRFFCPQIITKTGAKLSKSLIRTGDQTMNDVPEYLTDMSIFIKKHNNYLQDLILLTELFMSDPTHMFRSYSYEEIDRLIKYQ